MTIAGPGNVWNAARMGGRLAELHGVAPAPSHYAICRTTVDALGAETCLCVLPEQTGGQSRDALDVWLRDRAAAGIAALAISVLVIHEVLDANGAIRECSLERRRGSADGPPIGNPARTEFIGAARNVRLYRASTDGRLSEIALEPDAPAATEMFDPESGIDHFAGEDEALRERFGASMVLLDRRDPTLFEDRAGLSSVAHVRLPDKRAVACAIGWHGTVPFVLVANFPRFGIDPELSAADGSAVDRAARARGLLRREARADEKGLAVVARAAGGRDLFLLRPTPEGVRIEPHAAVSAESVTEDQRRWLHYAEAIEGWVILDAYRAGIDDRLAVLTGDVGGQVWRRTIDGDGVELSCRPDNETAAAELYRERLDAAPIANPPASDAQAEDESGPANSMLAKVRAYEAVVADLRRALTIGRAADDRGDLAPGPMVRLMEGAAVSFRALGATGAARAARDLARAGARGAMRVGALTESLAGVEERFHDELARLEIAVLAPVDVADAFGPEVEARFPEAVYQIEEAALCLALRRPTAAVAHAAKIMRIGLADLRPEDMFWPALAASVAERGSALVAALDDVRRRWRAPGLEPADKYTEQEAEASLDAVAAFMRARTMSRLP